MEERLTAAGGELLADLADGVAAVTLNRPAALNALTMGMIEGLAAWLEAWEADDRVRVVLLKGAGEKAFCAGGDIRALRENHLAGGDHSRRFFIVEYALDHRIHRYPKPVVALMDGIVMGGGMGISQGARLRLAGPRTRLAMPETAIGLFPDVGGSWFLPRCPGRVGAYLGLVGPTLGAADSLHAGLVDASAAPEAIARLPAELSGCALAEDPMAAVDSLRARLARDTPVPGELARLRPAIDRHFALPTVEAIVASLERETDPAFLPWADKTRALLATRSPTLLKVTLEQLRRGAGIGLAEGFRMEYGLVQACFEQGDFLEGVRALIVDKDNAPRWNPPSLAEVSDAAVAAFFAPRWAPAEHPLARLQSPRQGESP
jgi:enoyl-CoA hydratase/carnithine racemase